MHSQKILVEKYGKLSDNNRVVNLYNEFIEFAIKELKLKTPLPDITIDGDMHFAVKNKTFGMASTHKIVVSNSGRKLADTLRTLAHELVHCAQFQRGDDPDGTTGSKDENEANALAGSLLRKFGQSRPDIFTIQESIEPTEPADESWLFTDETVKELFCIVSHIFNITLFAREKQKIEDKAAYRYNDLLAEIKQSGLLLPTAWSQYSKDDQQAVDLLIKIVLLPREKQFELYESLKKKIRANLESSFEFSRKKGEPNLMDSKMWFKYTTYWNVYSKIANKALDQFRIDKLTTKGSEEAGINTDF